MQMVSVIVPIYNAGSKLKKCIQSILKQTYPNFELILINDGSTDESLKVCELYADRDARIRVIDKENEGSIATRQKGIDEAVGDYLMFVDADDWVASTIIERLISFVTEDQDVIVCNSYRVLNDRALLKQVNNSRYFTDYHEVCGDQIRTEIIEAYFHGHPFPATLYAKLFKKEIFNHSGKFIKRLKFLGDDLYLNLEVLLKANRIVIVNEPLYYYRVGGNTSRYMPYHFHDITCGYQIQKEVIYEYYGDYLSKHLTGISIMLLNSFRTTLQNICSSSLSETEIKREIRGYCSNLSVLEALEDKGAEEYLSSDYLELIKSCDVDALYDLGKRLYKKSYQKQRLIGLAAKFL